MSGNFISNPNVWRTPKADTEDSSKNKQANTKANTQGPTTDTIDVYFWYFDDASTETAIPSYSQNMPCVHDTDTTGVESVVNTIDGRQPVALDDYQTAGGKYRAVVKLFLLYEGQVTKNVTPDTATWAIATGWLISGDVVVTAGHCAYDYSHGLGRLIKAKAYVGYGSSSVAFRYGTAVATTAGWIGTNEVSEASDVSFIKLNSKFDSTEVQKFCTMIQTPSSQNAAMLGVVGYPGDIVNEKGERGGSMYQMFKPTDYDLENSYLHMLQYRIDTYGGNSGSPVFASQDDTLQVIGVHVLGGYRMNSASVIDGPYGNRCFAHYNIASVLTDDQHNPTDSTQPDESRKWLWKCPSTTTESDNDPVQKGLTETISQAKTVTDDIPSKILDHDHPLSFGSEAGPQIAVLNAAAIAAAGRLAADSVNGSNAESIANTRPYDGVLGRAIVAESALQHFLSMTDNEQQEFFPIMGPLVSALKPFVMKVSSRLLKGTLEPSMRLVLSNMASNLDNKNKRETRENEAEMDTGFGRKLTDEETVFLKGLMDAVSDDPGNKAVESFFSTLTTIGDVVGSAFKKVSPIIKDVARAGLPLLLGTEAGGLPATHLDPLAHRAILAESCLQAFIGMKNGDKKNRVYKKIIGTLKDLGPKLMRASPLVVKYIAPVVGDILREVNSNNKKEFLEYSYGD